MTEHLIELVRCETCLYDTNHPDYSKKTFKEVIWTKIAKELNYKDGPSAKDAWQKLRNCHRDAIRRRNKLYKSGSAATVYKPWKFETQMEFLVTYMTNRPTTGNMSTENPSSDQNLIQPEDLINYQEDEFAHNESFGRELLPLNITGNNSTEDPVATSQLRPSPLLQKEIPHTVTSTTKEPTTKKNDINTLIVNALQNHENRAKERAEKRAHHDDVDEMKLFFNAMYAITKKMPALSQHKLKRRIFNLVSDEEEYLLHLGPRSTFINSASGNTSNNCTDIISLSNPVPSPAYPMPSPGNPMPSPGNPMPSPGTPMPSPGTPMPSPGTPMPSPANPDTSYDWFSVYSQPDK